MADKGKSSSFLEREIRMVLVGKTGVGKSETGNTIAGAGKLAKIFPSLARAMSVTKKCKQHTFKRFGYDLQLVDVPGFCDTLKSHDEIKEEIMKCVAISSPGIHAILFIVSIGRFTEEDKNTLETFLRCFGEGAKKFVIVVFTGKDNLEADNSSLENYLSECPVTLKAFLFDVSRRCISVNNRGTDEEKEKFTKDLIGMIKTMVDENGGQCYTNEMYERCEAELREAEKKEKLEEKREKQLEEKLKQEAAAYEEKLQRQHLKMQELERQLQQNERRSEETKDEENQLRERLKALEEEKKGMAEQKKAAAEENMKREVQKLKDLQKTIREEHEVAAYEEKFKRQHLKMQELERQLQQNERRSKKDEENQLRERLKALEVRQNEEVKRKCLEEERKREEAEETMRKEIQKLKDFERKMEEEHERRREELHREEARKQIREKVEEDNTNYVQLVAGWVADKVTSYWPFSGWS